MSETCRYCRHWDDNGVCNLSHADLPGPTSEPETDCWMGASGWHDHGPALCTGPDFGCVLWEEKP